MEARLKIQKWGNGLGITIPSVIANGLSLKEGRYVSLQEDGNRIVVEPTKTNDTYNLNEMLNQITDNNIHHFIETGLPIGKEIWN